jgi:hypothetical protein
VSVSDTCLTRERLGHGCLRVRGVSSREIILFYSGHGRDTFQTRLRHSNVKIEKKKRRRRRRRRNFCIRATETLRSPFLSLMCCCLLSFCCMCLPFSFFPSVFQSRRSSCCFSLFSISLLFFFFFTLTHMLASWDGKVSGVFCTLGLGAVFSI